TGRVFMAIPSSQTLISMDRPVATDGHRRVKPSVYLRPMAQPISNRPATTRMAQFMLPPNGAVPSRMTRRGRPRLLSEAGVYQPRRPGPVSEGQPSSRCCGRSSVISYQGALLSTNTCFCGRTPGSLSRVPRGEPYTAGRASKRVYRLDTHTEQNALCSPGDDS